jgi:MFS family permease
MGILSAVGSASVLFFSLAAGVVADRFRRQPVMIAADLGRALLLAMVPTLALLHRLSITHLIAIAACTGVLSVLFDVAYQSYLPALAAPEDLFEGNRFLALSESTAEVLGPSLTGVLVQLITAPLAVLLDAVSFVVSAVSLMSIRTQESAPTPAPGVPIRTEIMEGMRVVLADPALRPLFFRSVAMYLSMGPFLSFYMLYAIRVLQIQPASLGLLIALGGVGSLAGAFLAPRISKRFSLPTLFISGLVMAVAQFLIPAASLSSRFAIPCLAVQQLVGDCAWTICLINETTLRQTVVPAKFLGRVNAAAQLASRGMLPIGALASGLLGTSLGIVASLWLGSAGVLLSTLCLIPVLVQIARNPVL